MLEYILLNEIKASLCCLQVMYFFGFMVMTFVVSAAASLAFESPMIALEKLVFKRNKGKIDKSQGKRENCAPKQIVNSVVVGDSEKKMKNLDGVMKF